jgi:hypothetical protein
MSLWTMPFWCAKSRALATDRARTLVALLADQIGERASLDESHREERAAVVMSGLVEGAQRRVIERGEQLGLALEAPERARRIEAAQDLDGDAASEPDVVRFVDRSLPAGPNEADELLGSDPALASRRLGLALGAGGSRPGCARTLGQARRRRLRLKTATASDARARTSRARRCPRFGLYRRS